ncbi:alpha,alpha-trehalase TreF [Eleftheria terrae]|uniref:alpha,alpha-trehalase TreF n=1 Tax=Eleftheria terrae TaxID=1597781 RepID=UPI00263AA3C6|nr:alpha,alpha-trehalase TreF [Eleftheria terrae]WKB55818.1 alpha,alpha-trehalase TreF [Eleftheria terrae]
MTVHSPVTASLPFIQLDTGRSRTAPCHAADRGRPPRRLRGLFAACLSLALLGGEATAQEGGRADPPLSPSQQYGALFVDVQMARLFPDSKTFADAVARRAPADILRDYEAQRSRPGFSLKAFVQENFTLPPEPATPPGDGGRNQRPPIDKHITELWAALARPAVPRPDPGGSLLPLPAPYVVPGGRFREIYYWDSYFTMLGLLQDGRRDLAQGLVDNFASQIDSWGHVPNGARSYYLSRSQPPFFHRMVGLLGRADEESDTPAAADQRAQSYARYLGQLKREHAFWMDGADRLAPGQAHRRVVVMPDGAVLNRYWDDRATPRDESYREDVETAAASPRPKDEVYRDLRAGAESGWDYSSRWFADGRTLATIQTTSLIPVDLNSLMYGLETAISEGCRWARDAACTRHYRTLALRRHAAIDRYLWDGERGFYVDYQWRSGQRQVALTAATVLPLFVGIASRPQADGVARAVQGQLMRPYGLATTRVDSGQQWDAPNGWSPLQWMAISGLRQNGHAPLARELATRWMQSVDRVYRDTGKLMEKYDVEAQRPGGGGEYPGQDGFGWTNGVMARLLALYPDALRSSRDRGSSPQRAGCRATPAARGQDETAAAACD